MRQAFYKIQSHGFRVTGIKIFQGPGKNFSGPGPGVTYGRKTGIINHYHDYLPGGRASAPQSEKIIESTPMPALKKSGHKKKNEGKEKNADQDPCSG
jgi:hypothetical protein